MKLLRNAQLQIRTDRWHALNTFLLCNIFQNLSLSFTDWNMTPNAQ